MVVESVSATASASSTTTLTITKPTGLAVGDLLVASLACYAADGTAGTSVAYNVPTNWAQSTGGTFGSAIVQSIQWKIADAGDVAAANFAFTTNNTADALIGKLIRASGHNTVTPSVSASSYTNEIASSATISATHSSYTPPVNGALVVIQFGYDHGSGGTVRSVSGYTTAGVSSFSEGYDTYGSDGSGGSGVALAYGIQDTATAISAYGATINASTDDHYGQIAIFLPPSSVSGTNDLVTTTSTTFTQSGTNDGIVGNILATATGQAFSQTGIGSTPTEWVNTDKSVSPSFTNTPKS